MHCRDFEIHIPNITTALMSKIPHLIDLHLHEMEINFSLEVWFHSFMVFPAVRCKAGHTDVRYSIPTFDNREH